MTSQLKEELKALEQRTPEILLADIAANPDCKADPYPAAFGGLTVLWTQMLKLAREAVAEAEAKERWGAAMEKAVQYQARAKFDEVMVAAAIHDDALRSGGSLDRTLEADEIENERAIPERQRCPNCRQYTGGGYCGDKCFATDHSEADFGDDAKPQLQLWRDACRRVLQNEAAM